MKNLNYTPTEKIKIARTVNRIDYITNASVNKTVLDLGCFDETALIKEESVNYLFKRISEVCENHIGVDNSELLPAHGLSFAENIKIISGDVYELDQLGLRNYNFDLVIAGELIEHLSDTLRFFRNMKRDFAGKRLICSTPNATSFSNMVLSLVNRESCHIDHYQIYSYKTLNTLCKKAGFNHWDIIPYYVKYTEMIMATRGLKRQAVKVSEKAINAIEYIFPMTAGGYIIDIKI